MKTSYPQSQVYDPLNDIHQYNTTLTIAQVMKFCEKKGLSVTRPMVQNYIRMGLLPPPVNKRFYTHNFLAALVLIDNLKEAFGIEEIKAALSPFLQEDGVPLEVYKKLINERTGLIREWEEKIRPMAVNNEGGEGKDFSRLLLMNHTADVKKSL